MKKILIIILIIIIGAGGFIYFNSSGNMEAVDPENPIDIDVSIAEGSSTNKIAEKLEDAGVIRNKRTFKSLVKERNLANQLKAGDYTFSTAMDLEQVLDQLVKGAREDTLKFTIPEGYELAQISEKLSSEGIVDKETFDRLVADKANFEDEYDFLKLLDEGQSLEGFLFPASYEIFLGESEENIIRRMLTAFDKIYKAELKDEIEKSDLSFNEIVTLASIIEREGKLDEERPLMSAVFYNRLNQNMRLMSCATVQYVIGERKEHLTNKDTSTPSLYNTYLHEGLPPAPIAAPGKASLLAAVYPADVDYLYFTLIGEDGSHAFTKTHEEHRRKTNEYRQGKP